MSDLVVERSSRGVVLLGVPVDANGSTSVGLRVGRFDQRPANPSPPGLLTDEEILEVAVARRGPRRGMEHRMRQTDGLLAAVDGHQAEEAVRLRAEP